MPSTRSSTRRRKSSVAEVVTKSRRSSTFAVFADDSSVTFAANVTPDSFAEDMNRSPYDDAPGDILPPDFEPAFAYVPPDAVQPSTKRKREKARRAEEGHIPRPPNAFMLFRSNLVRSGFSVPTEVQNQFNTLSGLAGWCWRKITPDEKRWWEAQAKQALRDHKAQHPDYKFRPKHKKVDDLEAVSDLSGKATGLRSSKATSRGRKLTPNQEETCDKLADLIVAGKNGKQLEDAFRRIDEGRHQQSDYTPEPQFSYPPSTAPATPEPNFSNAIQWSDPFSAPLTNFLGQRRSSSVPLPGTQQHPITLPVVPLIISSLDVSPDAPVIDCYHRRSSSAQPLGQYRSYITQQEPTYFSPPQQQMDTSLFNAAYLQPGGDPFSQYSMQPMSYNQMHPSHPSSSVGPRNERRDIDPLDNSVMGSINPGDVTLNQYWSSPMDPGYSMESQNSSSYSNSPASSSDLSLSSDQQYSQTSVYPTMQETSMIPAPTAMYPGMWGLGNIEYMENKVEHADPQQDFMPEFSDIYAGQEYQPVYDQQYAMPSYIGEA